MVAPVHTGTAIIQNNHIITSESISIVSQALNAGCIPIMYGEMVFDNTLGMSICSGDTIAMKLAKEYEAEKIIYASDVNGIYDKDPHTDKTAKIIKHIRLDLIHADKNIVLSGSHNIDVTGGIKNKIKVLMDNDLPQSLKKVVICNGLKSGTINNAFSSKEQGTVISI